MAACKDLKRHGLGTRAPVPATSTDMPKVIEHLFVTISRQFGSAVASPCPAHGCGVH
jgi:hypothetical protein